MFASRIGLRENGLLDRILKVILSPARLREAATWTLMAMYTCRRCQQQRHNLRRKCLENIYSAVLQLIDLDGKVNGDKELFNAAGTAVLSPLRHTCDAK